VGKTVKGVLADFKKTRQDTWGTDQKVCFLPFYFAVAAFAF
jgi:proteasome activator subunit 4